MSNKSFRAKPVGWKGESHRHYLAAKGISTNRKYNVKTGVGRFVESLYAQGDRRRSKFDAEGAMPSIQKLKMQREELKTPLTKTEQEKEIQIREALGAATRTDAIAYKRESIFSLYTSVESYLDDLSRASEKDIIDREKEIETIEDQLVKEKLEADLEKSQARLKNKIRDYEVVREFIRPYASNTNELVAKQDYLNNLNKLDPALKKSIISRLNTASAKI